MPHIRCPAPEGGATSEPRGPVSTLQRQRSGLSLAKDVLNVIYSIYWLIRFGFPSFFLVYLSIYHSDINVYFLF